MRRNEWRWSRKWGIRTQKRKKRGCTAWWSDDDLWEGNFIVMRWRWLLTRVHLGMHKHAWDLYFSYWVLTKEKRGRGEGNPPQDLIFVYFNVILKFIEDRSFQSYQWLRTKILFYLYIRARTRIILHKLIKSFGGGVGSKSYS